MTNILTLEKIDYLKEESGYGVRVCKKALVKARGDVNVALELLKKPNKPLSPRDMYEDWAARRYGNFFIKKDEYGHYIDPLCEFGFMVYKGVSEGEIK